MKKTRYTEEQIAFALKQAETGTRVEEVCRKMGISEATFYNWKKKFGGMGVTELRRLKQLEEDGSSYAYRVGGDEFLLICRNCSPEYPDLAANQILEMIRESNRAYDIPPCEIAVGTALREPGQSFADLEKLADDRMYVCKMQMKATGYSG